MTIGAELVTLLIAFPAAYAVARIQTRLSTIVESIFSLGFLIPGLAILMPIYLMTAKAGLLYNPIALVILYPAFNLPLSMILLTSFMRKLPRELEESAVMDGGNVLQIIVYIFLPICLPGIITVLVLNFINIWNEYLFALILMDSNNRTIQLATALAQGQPTIGRLWLDRSRGGDQHGACISSFCFLPGKDHERDAGRCSERIKIYPALNAQRSDPP